MQAGDKGFALVLSVLLLLVLVTLALGLLNLASIELRISARGNQVALARANARLAVIQAIGQLQRSLGPDQRISAPAEILRNRDVMQPHWTGVWQTTLKNGDPVMTRDDLTGSLRDQRWERHLDPADHVMEWLVSPSGGTISLCHQAKLPVVEVPLLEVAGKSGGVAGHLAWWTGDLGVRANLHTSDPRAALTANRSDPASGGLFRVMTTQAADPKLMAGGVELKNADRQKLLSPATLTLAEVDPKWVKQHAFDFTTESFGVLADGVDGGLKHDLTAYFQSGDVAPFKNLAGLTSTESLVGDDNAASRYRLAGPRFGLLRDWARLAVPFTGKNVAAKLPEHDSSAGTSSSARALANEMPVKLAGNQQAGLQPILVEATNFTQISTYLNKDGPTQWYQIRQLMYPRVVL